MQPRRVNTGAAPNPAQTMDILLAHGYFIAEDAHEQAIMKPYPPLGLLYISSHLKARGFDVAIFDSTFRTFADFVATIKEARPPRVGLYCNLMTKQNVLRMIAVCREHGARVILGGPEPVSYAAAYLAAGADVVVVGEGEETLEELIPLMQAAKAPDLSHVRGIIYAAGRAATGEVGEVVRTPPRPYIQDLSAQPWPDREAIDLERYLQTWERHHGARSTSLITARGCPYTCTWCSHTVFGHSHRRRAPADVADEVAYLVDRYRPDQLWYADDVLTIAHRWFLAYAEELEQRGLRVPFECISRADRLNETIVNTLAEMGCYRLWIGSESGSQRILDGMKRKADVADVQAKTKLLQSRGIQVGMFIMFGYEGEEISDIEATVEHLKKARPDQFLTTVAYPIKGTDYYEAVEDRIIAEDPWEERTDRDLQIAGRHSPAFYEAATRWVVNEVALHREWHGERRPFRLAKLFLNARRGRFGMALNRRNREDDERVPAGRGWAAEERAADGW
ncbi:MAG: radical SAM protein [Candidatus Promineifilaceae bacterium]|nr:radical SAM protein [Candidatus Promineifilaceae bacterium]